MRPLLLALAPLALASLAGGADVERAGPAPAAMRCTKAPVGGPKFEGTVYFTATATADTIPVSVPASLIEVMEDAERRQRESGHGGVVDADPGLRGLVFEVDGVDVVDPTVVAGHDRFLVVPWDYDAACRPLPWARAATFRPAGERGFLFGTLRDPGEWVDGLPTVDVHNPYARNLTREPRGARPADPARPDADDLLAFHRAMPWVGEVEARGVAAIEPAVAWLDARPEYADGALGMSLARLISAVNHADARYYDPPVVGTWRFDWALPRGEVVTYWARTESAPSGSEAIGDYPRPGIDRTLGVRAEVEARVPENGVRLLTFVTFDAAVATSPDPHPWLPDTPDEVRERWTRSPYGGLSIERHDRAEAGPEGPLRVDVQIGELGMLLPDRPDLAALRNDHFSDFRARTEAGEVISPAGRFVRDEGGEWHLEAEWTLLDGRMIGLRAERVNELHFPRWR